LTKSIPKNQMKQKEIDCAMRAPLNAGKPPKHKRETPTKKDLERRPFNACRSNTEKEAIVNLVGRFL